jgi:hypothetical protein
MFLYCGVLIHFSQWGATMLGIAKVGAGKKFMGVNSIVVSYDTKVVIFPEVAKKDNGDNSVLEAFIAWFVRVSSKISL